jgi:selenide,water dikinase
VLLEWSKVPLMPAAKLYARQGIAPDATFRNWNAVSADIRIEAGVDAMESFNFLPDPQTNGGLLITVRPDALAEVQECLNRAGYGDLLKPIGSVVTRFDNWLAIQP